MALKELGIVSMEKRLKKMHKEDQELSSLAQKLGPKIMSRY